MDAKQVNLQELVTDLARKDKDHHDDLAISPEMQALLDRGLHHVFLPPTLRPRAAEALQLAFEGIGGLPRLMMWADKNPTKFYNLFARMVPPTIAPVLPPPALAEHSWPSWLTSRRLAYQESAQIAEDITQKDPHASED